MRPQCTSLPKSIPRPVRCSPGMPFVLTLAECVAFADVNRRPRHFTCDRREFLGRHGSLAAPIALARVSLAERTGAALDPCAALQVPFDLLPGEETEIVFVLGEAKTAPAARELIARILNRAAPRGASTTRRRLGAPAFGGVDTHA